MTSARREVKFKLPAKLTSLSKQVLEAPLPEVFACLLVVVLEKLRVVV
jgi:hypothetical protein